MRVTNSKQSLSEKFATSMLSNLQLNKVRGGDNEIPPVIIPPTPVPPRK